VTGYGREALRDEERRVRAAQPGQRNEILSRAAYRCGQLCPHEVTEVEIEEVLTDAAVACGLPLDEVVRTIRSGLAAGQRAPRHPDRPITNRDEARSLVEQHDCMTRDLPHPGRHGTTEWLVHGALVDLAYVFGGPRAIPASCRRLAAHTGLAPTRVSQGLRGLIERGLIERTRWSRNGNPAQYRLCTPLPHHPCTHQTRTTVPRAPQDESTHNLIGPSRVDERNTVHHDAWRNGALGEMGLRIVDRLYRHPGKQTQTEVAQALGTTVGTINCHVGPSRPLAAYGLIDRAARGAIAVTRWPDIGLLDQIAVDLGTHGRYEALLDQIRQDYRDRGLLDADGYWLDPATGERKDKASWL